MSRRGDYHWLRIAAIAVGTLVLASCKSLPAPGVLSTAAVLADARPTAADPDEPPAGEGVVIDDRVERVGLEVPCPPLPRVGRCRGCGRCGSATAACPTAVCAPAVCLPPPGVPTAVPCLVCDGDDHGKPARPTRGGGLINLTAGDTVARYRPADAEPLVPGDLAEVCLATSNCTCVYAPRFSSVREILRPCEEAMPEGPGGLTADEHVDAQVDLLPVVAAAHRVPLGLARATQPGLAVEERLPALAVDQADLPLAEIAGAGPAEDVLDESLARAHAVEAPRMKVGFDVPVAWTCVSGAQVMIGEQAAEVIAADQNTATLRLEEPGRSELTLSKRAGSDTARVGEELDFTIFLLNSGDRPLTDILLVDALPKRLTLVPGSADSSLPAEIGTGVGDDGSVVVRWRLTGTLAPGAGGFVRFRTIVR